MTTNVNLSHGGYGQHPQDEDRQAMLPNSNQGNQMSNRPAPAQQGLPTPITYMHFFASTAITFGSAYGAFYCLFEDFQPVNMIQFLYLVVFGLGMMILDTPIGQSSPMIVTNREHVQTYVALLTRNVGKGAAFLFVGVMVWVGLLVNDVSVFLPAVLGIFIIGVGAVTAALGVRTSWLLNRMRYNMRDPNGGAGMGMDSFRMAYKQCASRPEGLTKMEFNQLSQQFIGISFPEADLKSVFNALSSDIHKMFISEKDFVDWKDGPMVFV